MFLLFYGKIGKGIDVRTRSESEIEIEICQQLDENIDKLINATNTEYHGFDSAGMINNLLIFEKFKSVTVFSNFSWMFLPPNFFSKFEL